MSDQHQNIFCSAGSAAEYINETHKILIHVLDKSDLAAWLAEQTVITKSWVEQQHFSAEPGQHLIIPAADGRMDCLLLGKHSQAGLRLLQDLPDVLPAGDYQLGEQLDAEVYLGWGLASYEFSRYKQVKTERPRLHLPTELNAEVLALLTSSFRVRDLVNTPAQDMGPANLAA
ncbi:MAG: hypothetical protein L3J24_12395, partial [Xanthomonadales bacterium]|nr:hypothetical protein [Xanthomonadales bacterium]